jgi:uncharacterized DUF497 family protein
MEVEFNPDKARSNLKKRKVSFAHAEQVFRYPMALTIEDPDSEGEVRFVTLGMDALGRVLVVVHTPRGDGFGSSPRARPVLVKRSNTMRKDYDFSKGKRGAVIPSTGKTRITIMLDDDLIAHFREVAEAEGTGYQTLINATLRAAVAAANERGADDRPLTVATLRKVLREELRIA